MPKGNTEVMNNSQKWLEHFMLNSLSLINELIFTITATGAQITNEEKQSISKSLQAFQLGENSEGKHLYKFAKEYSNKTGDHDYLKCISLFIKEEQNHSMYLGRFMDLAGIQKIKQNWVDDIFRFLRRLMGLEISICVLLTAELIAMVYYKALSKATRSKMLKLICGKILSDEMCHLKFHGERLEILREKRPEFFCYLSECLQKNFFLATAVIVWFHCRSTFKITGMDFTQYWSLCLKEIDNFFFTTDIAETAKV